MCAECTAPLEREIERLRRLTEQQAEALAAMRRERDAAMAIANSPEVAIRMCDDVATLVKERDAARTEVAAAHAALDDAHTPRERDGRTLTLAERIRAALPPLPKPAGEWQSWGRRIGHGVMVDAISVYVGNMRLARADAHRLLMLLRLALSPAGIPPTEVKP